MNEFSQLDLDISEAYQKKQMDKVCSLYYEAANYFEDKADIEVELGKVLLTGVVPYGDMRLEAVRLAWQQDGVVEVLNEISIDTGYGLDDIAKDKFISTQLFTKILTDSNIKKFKYDFEVQKQTVYLFGVSNDQNEINMVIDHAKSIKGVLDIINYIQAR